MTTQILPHNSTLHNPPILLVQTTRDLQGQVTGLVIPAGTLGKVLSYHNQILLVDFNLLTVCRLPVSSDAIKIVRA